MSQSTFELDEVFLVTETDAAKLFRLIDVDEEDAEMGEDQWWVPKSLIESTDCYRIGEEGYVEVPEWFAEKEGMC